MKNLLTYFITLSLIVLSACGGGSSSPEPAANRAPMASVPTDFSVVETTQVSLNGSASSDMDGTIISYAWIQTNGTPTVSLANADTSIAIFTAVDVDNDTLLTFELTVTDNDGASHSASVMVTIIPDQPPVAVAPADFDAAELSSVSLDASASTDDVAVVTYLWEQTAGLAVSLTNANTSVAFFTAPQFNPNQTISLTFGLTVTDALGATSSDQVVVTIVDTPTSVTLSGKLTYDHISHNASNGLDYNNIQQSNIRGATVELLDAGGASILDTITSDQNGDYSFIVSLNTSYVIRVKAELKKDDVIPTWDFTVVDNTNTKALYAMDSNVQAVASSSVTLNLNATSGWGSTSYTSDRVAAPFAILDSVYEAKEKVVTVDPTVAMASLKLNWSVNNVAVGGNTSTGQITTSHFNGTEIFILGDEDGDTDEYDGHVIIHEWGHYFEGRLSRSDSIGGSHGGGNKLDMRVALGEGWGNALSGIITDDSFYRDSFGSTQSQGFSINVESNPSGTNKGWFSESSVQSLIYDFYDSNDDGSDSLSLGFAPLYNVMIAGEKNLDAFTSIYSFANQLKLESSANSSAIDALLTSQDISVTDDFGTGETNDGGDPRNLPVYQILPVGGSVEVCSYGTNGEYNKLGNRKYLILDIANTGSYTITADGQTAGDDPELYVYLQGVQTFNSTADGNESTVQTINAGKYVMDIFEYSNTDQDNASVNRDTCIDVTLTAN